MQTNPKKHFVEPQEFMLYEEESCEGCSNIDECKKQHAAWVEEGKPIPLALTTKQFEEGIKQVQAKRKGLKALSKLLGGSVNPKYQVGDTVTVRADLQVGQKYGANSFVPAMKNAIGNTYTIRNILRGQYMLEGGPLRREPTAEERIKMAQRKINELDARSYLFTDEMIDHEATEALS